MAPVQGAALLLPPCCDSLKGDFSLLGHAGGPWSAREIEQVMGQECGKEYVRSWVGAQMSESLQRFFFPLFS